MIPLLMTRPRARSERFVVQLPEDTRGALEPVFAPMWRIEPCAPAPDFDVALITSANGVHFGPEAAGRIAYCVGTATAAKAREAGWQVVEAGQDAAVLVQTLTTARPAGRIMHLSGAQTRGDVVEQLQSIGLNVDRHVAYTQIPLPLSAQARGVLARGDVIVPLFSPNGAAHFADQAAGAGGVHVAAISAATAQKLKNFPARNVVIAAQPDARSVATAVGKLLRAVQSG